MKITYDEKEDVLRILITEAPIETVNHNGADQTLDYDQHGMLVGVEMRNTLQYMNRPAHVDVAILPAANGGDAAKADGHRLPAGGKARATKTASSA